MTLCEAAQLANELAWLAIILTLRRRPPLLGGFALVLGLMAVNQVQIALFKGTIAQSVVDLTDAGLSILSTWVLIRTALIELGNKSLVFPLGLMNGLPTVILFVMKDVIGSGSQRLQFIEMVDALSCVCGGGLLGWALWRGYSRRGVPLLGQISVFAGVCWGFCDTLEWSGAVTVDTAHWAMAVAAAAASALTIWFGRLDDSSEYSFVTTALGWQRRRFGSA